MKIQFTLILIAISLIKVSGQNSFEYVLNSDYPCSSYSVLESDNYYYMLGSYYWEGMGNMAFIARFTNGTDMITKNITKQDTNSKFFFGTQNNDGNLLIIGRAETQQKKEQFLYCCLMNEDLDILDEKYYSITPDEYTTIILYDMVIDPDGNIVVAGHLDNFAGTMGYCLTLVRINMNGDLIDYNYYPNINFDGRQWGELLARQNGSGYYYFNGGSFEWVKIDSQLQYVTGSFFYPNEIGLPATAKYLPDGNIAFVGQDDVGASYYDIVLNILTDDLQWVYDTAIVEPGRQCPAIFKGMDYTDPDNIWVVAFNDWIAPTGTEVYKFYIFDSQFNVKGSKYYGGDTDYNFRYLIATSDGGCLTSGTVREKEGSTHQVIFIKKVMPEDILTGNDEKVFSDFKDVLVYPNPFNDKVYLKTDRNDLTFNLFNSRGQLVYQGFITDRIKNEIDVGNLQKGIYVYSITNSAGKAIDGGKMLKK